MYSQGCALAEPGGLWCLTFVLGQLESLGFFIEIICWAHWILQVQSTGPPSIFSRAQPCTVYSEYTVQMFFLTMAFLTVKEN